MLWSCLLRWLRGGQALILAWFKVKNANLNIGRRLGYSYVSLVSNQQRWCLADNVFVWVLHFVISPYAIFLLVVMVYNIREAILTGRHHICFLHNYYDLCPFQSLSIWIQESLLPHFNVSSLIKNSKWVGITKSGCKNKQKILGNYFRQFTSKLLPDPNCAL